MNSSSTTFPDNCEDVLELLKKSPTFAMSLGAKELFHTNFLAFLLENQSEDKKLQCIQSKLKNLLFGHDGIGRVITWREKYSLDLVIMPAPVIKKNELGLDVKGPESTEALTIAVVIEVKLKSIPTQQQLEEYDLKLSSGITFELDDTDQQTCDDINYKFMRLCGDVQTPGIKILSEKNNKYSVKVFKGNIRRILLGTTKPNVERWDYIAWQQVVDCLQIDCLQIISDEGKSPQSEETELLRRLICDYRKSLNNILTILCRTELHVDEAIKNKTYQEYYGAIIAKRFRDLRIHDLVGKYANNVLEGKVVGCIRHNIKSFKIGNNNFNFNSYTFYSNQQPGVTFEWLCKEGKSEVSFGVTIQGYDYRHFISVDGKDKDARNLILKELENILDMASNNWFLKNLGSVPLLAKKANNIFYVFNESKFRYSKAPISDFKLKCLSGAVSSSLGSARGMVVKENAGFCNQLTEFFKVKSSI